MPAIARNQASNCANPILDIFTFQNSIMVDVYSLEFQVFEKVTTPGTPIQVYPATPGLRQAVNVTQLCPTGHKLGTGHYVAPWTAPINEPIGTHQIRWFFKLDVSSPEQSFTEEFEVLSEVSGSSSDGYCSVQDLRDEGLTVAMLSDVKAQQKIARMSERIDELTGWFFVPRQLTLTVDGRGSRVLHLGPPIIGLTSVDIVYDAATPSMTPVDLATLRIYNRHITQNLPSPDDRINPRLEFLPSDSEAYGVQTAAGGTFYESLAWPRGPQLIRVIGLFGYTVYDGTPVGRTPDAIREACVRLVLNSYQPLLTSGGSSATPAGPIVKERTRDQEVQYANLAGAGGKSARYTGLTGDPEIDTILLRYMRPPHIRGA
jgi:hypothetical protein